MTSRSHVTDRQTDKCKISIMMWGGGGGGGGLANADDIRTLTYSTSSLNAQLEAVSLFTTENFLQLNLSECEIVSFSRQSNCAQPQVSLDGATLQCKDVAKCLGYVWNSTLSSKPMIEHNITKARRYFFAYGSIGAYQGNISPLSCRSVIETCVMPIPLYGCESWSLCDSSLKALKSLALQESIAFTKMVLQYHLNDCDGLPTS